jgi:hypothetical protein
MSAFEGNADIVTRSDAAGAAEAVAVRGDRDRGPGSKAQIGEVNFSLAS